MSSKSPLIGSLFLSLSHPLVSLSIPLNSYIPSMHPKTPYTLEMCRVKLKKISGIGRMNGMGRIRSRNVSSGTYGTYGTIGTRGGISKSPLWVPCFLLREAIE